MAMPVAYGLDDDANMVKGEDRSPDFIMGEKRALMLYCQSSKRPNIRKRILRTGVLKKMVTALRLKTSQPLSNQGRPHSLCKTRPPDNTKLACP